VTRVTLCRAALHILLHPGRAALNRQPLRVVDCDGSLSFVTELDALFDILYERQEI